MRTLLPDPPPGEFRALLERRRQVGADPHDEVWERCAPHDSRAPWPPRRRSKLDFYACHEVEELLIVDPERRAVDWLALEEGRRYGRLIEQSGGLVDLGPAQLAELIDWPPTDA